MRGLAVTALAALAACSGPTPHRGWHPSPITGTLALDADVIARGELDGTVTVLARVSVPDHPATFGFVRLARTDLAAALRSPHVVLARARGFQALSYALWEDPIAEYTAAHLGFTALPACVASPLPAVDYPASVSTYDEAKRYVGPLRRDLVVRIRCYADAHRADVLPAGDTVAFSGDLVVREEGDAVSVLAVARLATLSAAGVVRVTRTPFDKAATSTFADLARGRAWQALAMQTTSPEETYEAAEKGMTAMTYCSVDRRLSFLLDARTKKDQGDIVGAARAMRDLLDRSIQACLRRKYESAW